MKQVDRVRKAEREVLRGLAQDRLRRGIAFLQRLHKMFRFPAACLTYGAAQNAAGTALL